MKILGPNDGCLTNAEVLEIVQEFRSQEDLTHLDAGQRECLRLCEQTLSESCGGGGTAGGTAAVPSMDKVRELCQALQPYDLSEEEFIQVANFGAHASPVAVSTFLQHYGYDIADELLLGIQGILGENEDEKRGQFEAVLERMAAARKQEEEAKAAAAKEEAAQKEAKEEEEAARAKAGAAKEEAEAEERRKKGNCTPRGSRAVYSELLPIASGGSATSVVNDTTPTSRAGADGGAPPPGAERKKRKRKESANSSAEDSRKAMNDDEEKAGAGVLGESVTEKGPMKRTRATAKAKAEAAAGTTTTTKKKEGNASSSASPKAKAKAKAEKTKKAGGKKI